MLLLMFPPPVTSSRSSGISRSCRSLFRCVGATQPCTCYIIPSVLVAYMLLSISPPLPKSTGSSGISRSCRSMFPCDGGTQPCTCYIIPSVLVAYMLFWILSTQRGASWIISTMCFATLLMSNGPRPHPRRSRSCGNSRSFRSVFRFGSGTQRGAYCIIPTLCFATLLISSCTAPLPPTAEEVEVVEIM